MASAGECRSRETLWTHRVSVVILFYVLTFEHVNGFPDVFDILPLGLFSSSLLFFGYALGSVCKLNPWKMERAALFGM